MKSRNLRIHLGNRPIILDLDLELMPVADFDGDDLVERELVARVLGVPDEVLDEGWWHPVSRVVSHSIEYALLDEHPNVDPLFGRGDGLSCSMYLEHVVW